MSRKVLMVIAPDQFRDEELLVPRAYLKEQGFTVDTASTQAGEAKGMLGAVESISLTLDQVNASEYEALVVVGGMGSVEHLWNNPTLHSLLVSVAEKNGVIAAICLSGVVLANAGLLQGKKATVWERPESLEALKAGGASYTGEPCTVDGNVITANGPDAATAFAQAITERVKTLTPA